MKKFLVCLLAAAALAGPVFGQFKLDGYFNGGIGLGVSNVEGADPWIRSYGVDSERRVGRSRLNGAYSNEEKTAGANFRFQVQGSHEKPNTSGVGLAYGYGWVKPVDMLNIKLGLVDDATWETGDALFKDDNGEGLGVLVKLSPIAGLDLGAGVYTAAYASSDNNNILDSHAGDSLALENGKYTVSAAYTAADLFRAAASYRSWNDNNSAGREGSSQLTGEIRVLAVKNLTAIVVAQVIGLAGSSDFSGSGQINLFETAGYKAGNLGFGLNAAQMLSNKPADKDAGLLFSPWVSYGLGSVTPKLEAAYFMGGGPALADESPLPFRKIGAYKASYDSGDYVFVVRPSVGIKFGADAALEIGDAFFFGEAANFAKDAAGGAALVNMFYLDLTIRFK